jgi:hypothetical protein
VPSRDQGECESLKQCVIDVLGVLILVAGVPLLIWYFATQDIGPLLDFFTAK